MSGSYLPTATRASLEYSYFGADGGDSQSPNLVVSTINTGTIEVRNTTIGMGSNNYISTIGSQLFYYNGSVLEPISRISSISSIAEWSLEPAISNIDADGYDIQNVNALEAGLVEAPLVKADEVSTGQVFASMVSSAQVFASSIKAYSLSVEQIINLSTINTIDYISTEQVVTDNVIAKNGSISTLNTSNISIVNINGNPISAYAASNWWQYGANGDVDVGNYNLLNVLQATFSNIQGGTQDFIIENYAGGSGTATLSGGAGAKLLGGTGDVDISGNDVNIATTGLTSILDINAAAAIDISAGGAVGINAVGAVEIAATGIVSIGSANYTSIEGVNIDDNVITATSTKLDIQDVGSISNNATLGITTTGASSELNLTSGSDMNIKPAGNLNIGGYTINSIPYVLVGTNSGIDLFTNTNIGLTANQFVNISGYSNIGLNSVVGDITLNATTDIQINSGNGGIQLNADAGNEPIALIGSALTFNGQPLVAGSISTISTFQQLFTSTLTASTITAPVLYGSSLFGVGEINNAAHDLFMACQTLVINSIQSTDITASEALNVKAGDITLFPLSGNLFASAISTIALEAVEGIQLDAPILNYNGKPILTNVLNTSVAAEGFNVTGVGTLRTSVLQTDDIILPLGSLQAAIEVGDKIQFNEDVIVAPAKNVRIGTLNYVDTGSYVAGDTKDGFAQGVLVQNKSATANASMNIVAVNDSAGTDYVALGINSSAYAPLNNTLFELPNGSYMSGTENTIIGAQSDHSANASLYMTYNSGAQALQLNPQGAIG
jgi:hypothetical protein